MSLELDATTWTLEPGHTLRLAIAGTDWPNCWPPPGPVTLEVDAASVTAAAARDRRPAGIGPPVRAWRVDQQPTRPMASCGESSTTSSAGALRWSQVRGDVRRDARGTDHRRLSRPARRVDGQPGRCLGRRRGVVRDHVARGNMPQRSNAVGPLRRADDSRSSSTSSSPRVTPRSPTSTGKPRCHAAGDTSHRYGWPDHECGSC